MAQRLVGLTFLQVNFINALAGSERFNHGIAALNDAIRLGGKIVFSALLHSLSLSRKRLSRT